MYSDPRSAGPSIIPVLVVVGLLVLVCIVAGSITKHMIEKNAFAAAKAVHILIMAVLASIAAFCWARCLRYGKHSNARQVHGALGSALAIITFMVLLATNQVWATFPERARLVLVKRMARAIDSAKTIELDPGDVALKGRAIVVCDKGLEVGGLHGGNHGSPLGPEEAMALRECDFVRDKLYGLSAEASDSEITLFAIVGIRHLLEIGKYGHLGFSTGVTAYESEWSICVVNWPENRAVGVTRIKVRDPTAYSITVAHSPGNTTSVSDFESQRARVVAEWIRNLKRSRAPQQPQ